MPRERTRAALIETRDRLTAILDETMPPEPLCSELVQMLRVVSLALDGERTCRREGCHEEGVEESPGSPGEYYCARHWCEATTEGE